MIGRLALRSLTAHPVRSAVLAAGFGVGVAVMAILLGVAQIVLQQAQSPSLVGGGDVVIRLTSQVPARLLLSGTLQSDALRDRIRVAAPSHTTELFLISGGGGDGGGGGPEGPPLQGPPLQGSPPQGSPPQSSPPQALPPQALRPQNPAPGGRRATRVDARGGIPSLERGLGDNEV